MKEFNDKGFDEIFKNRITEELPEFELESWLKMEQKLRKRDRLVFYRNASIILLLLSFGISFYLISRKPAIKDEGKIANKVKPKQGPAVTSAIAFTSPGAPKKVTAFTSKALYVKEFPPIESHQDLTAVYSALPKPSVEQQINNEEKLSDDRIVVSTMPGDKSTGISNSNLPNVQVAGQLDDVQSKGRKEKSRTSKLKFPISLAIVAGPDFNSTTALIGGKPNLTFGLNVSVGVAKKWSVQTGISYGHKNYDATASNYTFNNPNTKNTIAEVNAACKVLEIPLRASLNVSENEKRSIELNAGLSSYLMLKEDYVYKYTAASGRSDRFVQATNQNQHFLSVVDLSATYNIKLKPKKLALGIEPYIKIPLTGIGQGGVPLKSSGVSLKLRYDFNKK